MKKLLSLTLVTLTLLAAAPALLAADAANGKGTVNRINADAGSVNLSHEAIPAIKWPAMTMDIKVADKKILSGVKAGQTVTFGLIKDPRAGYVISHIEVAK
jgi:Cu/Ag efflux protein CusF